MGLRLGYPNPQQQKTTHTPRIHCRERPPPTRLTRLDDAVLEHVEAGPRTLKNKNTPPRNRQKEAAEGTSPPSPWLTLIPIRAMQPAQRREHESPHHELWHADGQLVILLNNLAPKRLQRTSRLSSKKNWQTVKHAQRNLLMKQDTQPRARSNTRFISRIYIHITRQQQYLKLIYQHLCTHPHGALLTAHTFSIASATQQVQTHREKLQPPTQAGYNRKEPNPHITMQQTVFSRFVSYRRRARTSRSGVTSGTHIADSLVYGIRIVPPRPAIVTFVQSTELAELRAVTVTRTA